MATLKEHQELLQLLYKQNIVHSRIYGAMSREFAEVLKKYKMPSTGSVWNRNKIIEKSINTILEKYQKVILNSIYAYNNIAWTLSDKHNDNLVNSYVKGVKVTKAQLSPLLKLNSSAVIAFNERVTDGLNLSDRVWKVTRTTKSQLEVFLSEGLSEGRSASLLTKDIKQFLSNPDKRFRRVRNPETGKLMISKPGSNYNPGRGVYRSSYKNALRLSRNEINIAYRSSDMERRANLPFVTGIKVNLSNAHPEYDICDELQGEYPKDFNFIGWHPNCLCFTTSKLLSKKDFVSQLKGKQIPKAKQTSKIPDRAKDYLNSNSDRIKNLSNQPYFIKDNFKSTKKGFQLI